MIDCPDDIEVLTWPGAIAQILTNLVMNSLIHAFEPDASGTITVTGRSATETVEIVYSDNGKGIAPENLKRIFEPFFTTRRGQGGSGLGLSVVQRLVIDRLGGKIVAQSKIGRGTTFVISIPKGSENSTPAAYLH